MNNDLARYRQLATVLAKGARVGWLARGRAMHEMKRDRVYLMSGATTFRKWCESFFSAKRLKAVESEMLAAILHDECLEQKLSPPPTLSTAASIGAVEKRMEICKAANEIAARRGDQIATIADYNKAIRQFLIDGTRREALDGGFRNGKRLLALATKVNMVIKEVQAKRNDPGFELIKEHWGQVGAYLRRGWAALFSSAPWSICPVCIGNGCERCSDRGWLGKTQLRDVLKTGVTEAQIKLSKLATQGAKSVDSIPANYAFARRIGLQVCVRCGDPIRYGLSCADCTKQSQQGLTKRQVLAWLEECKLNVSSDPENALDHLEHVTMLVEEWTGKELGFKGSEYVRRNHESKVEAKGAGGTDGTGGNLGATSVSE